ncbi:conserved hypothetical protein [Planktothrix agardhii]|uniref:hypothetical protein n=1 Tax=Planktothrix agardhii TaxID=1160 RepID=UPI001B96355E|nr:hypothetical protein [Planktothrix agardhii]CAD0222310.1 conserved hypothetical protein [Planktothrix agardhii]
MKNITFSCYAFHLQQRLDDPPDVPNPQAESLWESLTFLPFPELKNIKSQPEEEVQLTAIPTNFGFKLKGNLQAFLLNDTYCVDITLKPEGENVEVEVAQLSAFQPQVFLNQITADLGKVLTIHGEQNYWIKPKLEDAENWANALCAGTSFNPQFIDQLELFDCPCFLFEAGDLTIIISLAKPKQLDLEKANDNYSWLRDLFWCQKKIVATYSKAKESYQTVRELYSKLENNVPEFYTISNETPEQRLNSLDLMVQEIPQNLLYYNCCLRDLKTHYTTIKTNSDNFKTCLNSLLEAGNKLEVWSRLAEKTYPLYLRQIETYLEYLEPGKDLFSDLINTIRARTEIEQAKSNQDLQDHIQSIGVGIGAGAIIASISGLMMTPWSPPTRDNWIKPLSIHPFIIVLAVSTFCSWGAWKLMKCGIKSQRKRSLKNISQKTALKKEGNST